MVDTGEKDGTGEQANDKTKTPASPGKPPASPGKKTKDKNPKEKSSPEKKGTPKAKAKAKLLVKAMKTVQAKAKAKAKAKGKAKAKTSPKPKSQPKKKPAKSEDAKKRPSAASSQPKTKAKAESMADKFQKWREGIKNPPDDEEKVDDETAEGAEEEVPENDEEVDPNDQKRNKYAAAKFQSLLKSGQVPEHIKQMWEKGNRQLKTELVNNLFQQDKKTGKWQMNANNPEFERMVKTQEEAFGKDQVESFPRSVMLYSIFRGDQQALEKAIADGEVIETETGGKVLLGFQKVKAGKKRSNLDETKTKSGAAALTQEGYAHMADLASKFQWHSFGKKALGDGQEDSSSGAKKKALLAIQDKQALTWDTCEGVFQEAVAAQDRLLKEAGKVQQAVAASKDTNLIGQFKESYSAFKSNHTLLQEALLWKDWC